MFFIVLFKINNINKKYNYLQFVNMLFLYGYPFEKTTVIVIC